MADTARVSSIEAIAAFRARLLVFLTKSRPALEEISGEIMRTRMWLQNDQRIHWEGQARQRAKKLETAQHELYSARLARLRDASTAEQAAVNKARRALDEAEEKLRRLKRWNRDFDSEVEPLVKQVEKLQTFLVLDLNKAAVHLAQILKTLDAYANAGPPATRVAEPTSAATTGADATAPAPVAVVETRIAPTPDRLPLPARDERGEGRGEGQPQAKQTSSPRPAPPTAGGEGDEGNRVSAPILDSASASVPSNSVTP